MGISASISSLAATSASGLAAGGAGATGGGLSSRSGGSGGVFSPASSIGSPKFGASGSLGGGSLSASTRGGAAPAKLAPSPEKTLEFKSVPSDDVPALEAAIIRQVFERRIRTRELFADFDPLRKGKVTRSQFARALRSARLEGISPAGVAAVAEKYATHDEVDSINYAAFCAFVDEAFTETELEKDPTKPLDSFAHTVVTSPHPRFVRPVFEGAQAEALARAVEGIKSHIQRWRTYNVKAWLQGYDKACEGMVTETQFLRVLAAFNLVPVATAEREAVLDYYRGKGIKAHMIDYRAFLQDVYTDGIE